MLIIDTTSTAARGRRFVLAVLCAAATLCAVPVLAGGEGAPDEITRLESVVGGDPENLKAAAEYRQRVIALGLYDRSIKFFEQLASRPAAGTNVFLSLSLAYVDKVPASGAMRQLYLGKDAMDAATKALGRQPGNLVALYVQGLINLYYDRFVFKRTQKGVDDLELARRMLSGKPPEAYHARIFMSLGDGYYRLEKVDTARAAWKEGLSRFPDFEPLKARAASDGMDLRRIVDRTLDPNTRVDTSLRELFPPSAVAAARLQD